MDSVVVSRNIIAGKKKTLEGIDTNTSLAFWLQEVLALVSAGQH